jgi:saccharopine dehydrogenase-like NADP-dependent oxidoreductase
MDVKIFIAGAGGIGQAAGLILEENPAMNVHLVFGDISERAAQGAANMVKYSSDRAIHVDYMVMPLQGSTGEMDAVLDSCDMILDCLPGSQAPRMARFAKQFHCHYANLTEYVAETKEIMEIATDADTSFVLQTGLAPGFINVLAHRLYEEFVNDFDVETADDMQMKVGAISRHAPAPHFYAFTWSPIGVATEYVKDAEIVRDYKKILVPALSGLDSIVIDGEHYEDNYTSGGAADLPDYFNGKIRNLSYKTLRFPGHYDWVKEKLDSYREDQNKIKLLEKEMLENIPMVEDDAVVVYASVQGKDSFGALRKKEKSYKIRPSLVGDKMMRAIQTTTAAPMCQMAYLALSGQLNKGVVLQSQIPTLEFLNGDYVKAVYGAYE